MTPDAIAIARTKLVGLRAELDDVITQLGSAAAQPKRIATLTVTEYAEHRSVSTKTIRRWIAQGMPHRRAGARLIRIDPTFADPWEPEDLTALDARASARKGRR